jgi:hypothetical protein
MASKKIRVRSKRLAQISEDRLALAIWLMARDLADQEDTAAKAAPSDASDSTSSQEQA